MICVLAPHTHAQIKNLLEGPKSPEKVEKIPTIKISEQLSIWNKQVEDDLAKLSKYTGEATLPAKISQTDLENRRLTLERTKYAIKRHVDELKSIEDNKTALETAKTTAKDWNGYGDNPPTSILVVDELSNRKQAIIDEREFDQSSLVISERTLNTWFEELKKADVRIADAKKAYDASGDQNHTTLWNLDTEKEKHRQLFIQSSTLQHSITALKTNIQTHDIESELLNRKIRLANQTASLTDKDIAQIKAASTDRQKSLQSELDSFRSRQNKSTSDEAKALAELEKAKAAATPDPLATELAAINYEAAQARSTSIQHMINLLETFSQIEAFIPEAYQHRSVILNPKSSTKQRSESIAALQTIQQRTMAWEIISNNEVNSITAAISAQQARATAYSADDPRLPAINRIRTALWERQALIQRLNQAISTQIRILNSWLSAYLTDYKTPWSKKVSGSFKNFWSSANRIWNVSVLQYEQSVERDGQTIAEPRNVTLGSIISALILFIIAYLISGNLVKRLQLQLIKRRILREYQARTLRNWLMLGIGFMLALATLNWLNIPLTIFAFLAGALAIGVGFGTQTIIKNFISGIILLFERKVRVGDTIEVNGIVGIVSEINTRSSIIRSTNGIENLIPNSLFLENRVSNWTLSNRLIRREIKLVVAYGSPTQDIITILTESAERHGLVLDHPEPIATLSNFGEKYIEFTLFFWIEQNDKSSAIIVESDLRIIIDKRLTEEGISAPTV
jgi:potassium-dependent mechanosensitive channel